MGMMMAAHDPVFSSEPNDAVQVHTVATAAVTWNVLETGHGPTLLLLHGTGSSTHSWRGLLPLLSDHFRLIAPDLPGHGASVLHDERALSLEGMSQELGNLLRELDVNPSIVVGHSAGAALAARAMLDGIMHCDLLVSINGAFVPFGGPMGQLFSPVAKLFAASGLLARMIARHAVSPQSVERLLASTGSVIDEQYIEGYRQLFASPDHVAATLGMMAKWDLWSLQRDLPQLPATLILLAGDGDRTVPPAQAVAVAAEVPGSRAVMLKGLGHQAHEEAPDVVAQQIFLGEASIAANSR